MGLAKIRRSQVFVSYSHKDGEWIAPLRDHLSGLGESAVWIDSDDIDAGEQWDKEIELGLASARVAVLLISASFLASRYISEKELPYLLDAAEEQQVTLLPIYLLPCDVPPRLAAYQAINSPDRTLADLKDDPAAQARVWMAVNKKIESVLSELVLVTAASEDHDQVEQILGELEAMGLAFDLEVYDRAQDQALQARVRGKLGKRQATLLTVGARGFGLWGVEVMQQALRAEREALLATTSSRRLISAFLPGGPSKLEIPSFLPDNTCIRFPRGLDDPATLDRIWMGLTGKWKPRAAVEPTPSPTETDVTDRQPAPATVASPPDPVASKLDGLIDQMAYEDLTILLGSDLAGDRDSATEDWPPRPFELTRGLLEELELNRPDFDRLLLPFDLAGTYFAVRNGERRLEIKLREMVSRGTELTSTHHQIAHLLRTSLELEERISRRGQPPTRLIVTTNIDLMMERALLLAEVPFVRLVQERSGNKIVVNAFQSVTTVGDHILLRNGDDELRARRDDLDEICDAITDFGREELVYRDPGGPASGGGAPQGDASQNALRTLPLERYQTRTFLYKLYGSEDVKRSCAISIDQHFRLLRTVLEKNIIPLKITEHLADGPLLVFGYGLLDPPFRMLLHTLPVAIRSDFNDERLLYLFQQPPARDDPDPFRRLDEHLWPKIKEQARHLGIELFEMRGDLFLEKLIRGLGERFGGSDETYR